MISALVKKEAGLAAMPLTYIFIAFSAMTMIPKYPILVGSFFICLGIFYSFQFAREQNDTLYTVLLPVSKRDAVKAKYIFVCLVQAISFILICLFSFLRVSLAKTSDVYADNTMLGASAAYLGCVLIVFALFNTVFLASFYKTAYAIGKPFLAFSVCAFLFIAAAETVHHIPPVASLGADGKRILHLCVFAAGALIYIFGTYFSFHLSAGRFENVDL